MWRRARAQVRQVADEMRRNPSAVCGALLLTCVTALLTLRLTYSRAKSVVVPAPPPERFFSPHVPVLDLFLGQQDQAERLRERADVSVLFYYAPWCAHSIAARDHVQQVALRLAGEVQFVAVNCWWSQGKCRKHHNFYQYPVIHLYYRRFGPIEYKGPVLAQYVESFIRRVSAPLVYLPTRSALHRFISHHQQGVVGFFEFNSSPQPPGYVTFLSSALHALRRDSQGAVRFGVVTSQEVAESISVRKDETVYLHRRFNHSLIFPREQKNFTAEAVCSWVYENRESVIRWIQPMGAKSYSLEAELHKGPALLMFLPHNPLTASHHLLSEVADVVLRYHSCCLAEEVTSGSAPGCCQSLLVPAWRTDSAVANVSICELCLTWSSTSPSPESPSHCSAADLQEVAVSYLRRDPVPRSCSGIANAYSPFLHYSACCRTADAAAQPEPDCPVATALATAAAEEGEDDVMVGLRCRTNKTLRFYLLDSHLAWPLAHRLGALANQSTNAFSTIINLRDETHYVLDNTEKHSLESFILNFSAPYSPLHRHLVGHKQLHPPQSLIQEVTTHSFLDTVMDPDRDVLLFYYTGWCGFCTVLNHVLLRLAQLFQGNGALTVARVNVGLNDLPWEFMVDHLPSFLFFPRYRKQASVKFPESVPMTVPNLVRFVLQHSSPASRETAPESLLEAELRALQGEVLSLQQARERLSNQLASLWGDNRRLALHAHALQAHNAQLRAQSGRLESQYREKSRQLAEAVARLQELAHASQELLTENSLLKVLLSLMKEREGASERDGENAKQEAS